MKQFMVTMFLLVAVSITNTTSLCPEKCLCDTVKKYVSCISKSLTSVPRGIPTDTLILSLENNLISELSPNDFNGLSSLGKLFLNDNAITSIANSTFSELQSLVELSLNSNQMIKTINVDTFSSLQKLEILRMNQIHSPGMVPCIDDFAFSKLSSLKTLTLTNNDFYFISKHLFTGLTSLTNLHITLNLFSKLDSEAFSSIRSNKTKNQTLMVDLGPFHTGVCCCSTYQAIRTLNHHTNTSCTEFCYDVHGICDVQYNSTCIKKLNTQGEDDSLSVNSRITASTTTTSELTHPTRLSDNWMTSTTFTSNMIHPTPLMGQITPTKLASETTIEPEPQRPSNPRKKGFCPDQCTCYDDFQTVICQRRQLSAVPQDLPSETRKLILNGNLMSRIKKYDFYDLFSLEMLYLHDNKIRKIDDGSFEDLHNLKQLFLLNNEIKSITKYTFKGLDSLETLWLSNLNTENDLVTIEDGSFKTLGNLENLIINGNKFVALTDNTFEGLAKLDLLHISIHQLGVISRNAFDGLPMNTSIHTDPYDIKICCCSSAVALNDSRINRKSLQTKCTELTCHEHEEVNDICQMKFSSTTSNYTELDHLLTTVSATSLTPYTARKIDSDITQISVALSTEMISQPTQSTNEQANASVNIFSVQGDQGFRQKQDTNISTTTEATAPSNNATLKPPVKMPFEWGNDKNSATKSHSKSVNFAFINILLFHYMYL